MNNEPVFFLSRVIYINTDKGQR